MLYDSTVLASCRILPVRACQRRGYVEGSRGKLTRVDEFLLRYLPALVRLDLRLELADLCEMSAIHSAVDVELRRVLVPFLMARPR